MSIWIGPKNMLINEKSKFQNDIYSIISFVYIERSNNATYYLQLVNHKNMDGKDTHASGDRGRGKRGGL